VAHLRRSDLPDGFFHIYARGVCGIGPIFGDREDYETFFRFLSNATRRHAWQCHAVCVLNTHYHVVVYARRADLSAGCEELNWNYAVYFNRKHERFGHLFAERFSSRVIESARTTSTTRACTSCSIQSRPGCARGSRTGHGRGAATT
jgi:putative transposase